MILFSWLLANTLLVTGLFALTYAFYRLLQAVPPSRVLNEDLPFVSIVVPARNEEGKIGRCLASLLAQDYQRFEIIVIDDRSTDNTAQIIQSLVDRDPNKRIKFVHGKDAPAGWVGKCNALAHAVSYASGDWFLFTDADTFHKPNSIKDAVSYAAKNRMDMVSFVPLQELGSFPEKLIMPVLLSSFLLGDPFHAVNDPDAERAYAYGQYVICKRGPYLALGGHQSVRDEIVEDHALGKVFKENSYKIAVADGKTLYSVRMYTDLASLWLGWTKNLYSLIDSRIANLLMVLFLINSAVLVPFIQLGFVSYIFAKGVIAGNITPLVWIMTGLITAQFIVLLLWSRKTSTHHFGVDWRTFFLIPFGSISITILYFHAAYLVLSGSQVNWKGRRYVVNTEKTIGRSTNPPLDPILDAAILPEVREVREVSTIR